MVGWVEWDLVWEGRMGEVGLGGWVVTTAQDLVFRWGGTQECGRSGGRTLQPMGHCNSAALRKAVFTLGDARSFV